MICKMAMEHARTKGAAAMAFVDIKNAYDNVNRNTLWKILEGTCWSSQDIHVLERLYAYAGVRIAVEGGKQIRYIKIKD